MKFDDKVSEHGEVPMNVSRIIFRRSLRRLIVGTEAQGSNPRRVPRSRHPLGPVFGCV